MKEITLKNVFRTRKFGWGWSCTPTGRDAYEIQTPTHPDYTGTLRQIGEAKATDRTWQSMASGGTFTNQAWFYNGKRITHTWRWGILKGLGWDDPDLVTGYGWVPGLHLNDEGSTELKIRVD